MKAFAFALVICGCTALLLSGCSGGSGSIGGGGTPLPTVSITATPNPTNAGATVTLIVSSMNANSCAWTAGKPAGSAPCNGTATDVPAGTTTYTVQASGNGGSNSASVTVTLNATITSVTVTANPTNITTAQTSALSATVQGIGSFGTAVTWTATGGTVSGSGDIVTFTPSGAGATSVKACSSLQGFTDVCGSANITVTRATPAIASVGIGYFSDPYLVPFSGATSTYISGTTQDYLICSGDLSPDCAQETSNRVDYTNLQSQANQAGAEICAIAGLRPFQESSGLWDMVLVLHMETLGNCGASSHWNVLVHASPNTESTTPPVNWTADTVLVGSFTDSSVQANYDGRYFEDNGQLYLVYVRSLSTSPRRFGLVAQAMVSPTTLDSTGPVLLLQPNPDNNDPLNSEGYSSLTDSFKLVESGNIMKINGKYVLVYSAGQYDANTYKAAVAYSDTFLPAAGETYRKVTMPDPSGVWGNTNDEVVYLLQSQEQNWAGYVASQVVAPGVATVATVGPNGSWVLVFAGYAPNDTGSGQNGNTYLGSKRRPFYVDLKVAVPTDISVAQATEAELASWITLSTN